MFRLSKDSKIITREEILEKVKTVAAKSSCSEAADEFRRFFRISSAFSGLLLFWM